MDREDRERHLLQALCQTRDGSLRKRALQSLARHSWAHSDHRILFEAWAALVGAGSGISIQAIAVQATRAGFPDLDFDVLFVPLPHPDEDLAYLLEEIAKDGDHRQAGSAVMKQGQLLWWLGLAEVLAFPVLTLVFIWRWQSTWPASWIIFPIWLVGSFLLHRDTPRFLGARADNLGPALRESGFFFGIVIVIVLVFGLLRGAPWQLDWSDVGRHLWAYFAFCLLQQVALNSFLNNRMISLVSRTWLSSLLVGIMFASAHWPNPVLVPVTLIGGVGMAWLFRRNRNILPLALGQALVGALLGWSMPAAWVHHMRVGPGFYRWK